MKDDNAFLEGIYKKAEDYKSEDAKPKGFTTPTISFVKRYAGAAAAAVLVAVAAPSLYFGLNRSYPMASMASDQHMTQEIMTAQDATAGSPTPPRSAAPTPEAGKKADEPMAAQTYESPQTGTGAVDEGSEIDPILNEYSTLPADVPSISYSAEAADVVVVATVTKIEKSVYESENEIDNRMSTTVHFKARDVLKGDIENTFTVKVSGGFDPENSNYLPYEVVFEKKEKALLMLTAMQVAADAAEDQTAYTLTGSSMGKLVPVDKNDKEASIYVDRVGNTITIAELKSML